MAEGVVVVPGLKLLGTQETLQDIGIPIFPWIQCNPRQITSATISKSMTQKNLKTKFSSGKIINNLSYNISKIVHYDTPK